MKKNCSNEERELAIKALLRANERLLKEVAENEKLIAELRAEIEECENV